jgi:hypothetical protein
MRNPAHDGTRQAGENPVKTTTGNDLPGAVRASDADRDAVVSDLSQHFQAGRLTVEELDERTGKALAARTYGELRELMADLPGLQSGARDRVAVPAGAEPATPPRHGGPPLIGSVIGVAIVAMVLLAVAGGWGLIWIIPAALIIARRTFCLHGHPGTAAKRLN